MSISTIKESVVSGLSKAGNAIANTTFWCGRKISSGFNNYLVPAVSKIWNFIKSAFSHTVAFFRTGPGLATIGFGAGVSLAALSFSKKFENDLPARVGLISLSCLCFLGCGVAVGLSITKGPGALI